MKNLKIKLITDTVNYYSKHPRNIGIDHKGVYGMVLYSGESFKNKTDGCAIGRILPRDLRVQIDRNFGECPLLEIFKFFPEEIQDLGIEYIIDLGLLHDTPYFWKGNQLTEFGVNFLKELTQKYK